MKSISSISLTKRTIAVFLLPLLLLGGLILQQSRTAVAAPSDIEVTIFAAPNLVVDSNVLSPSTQAPEVATVIGRFCNTSGVTQTGVIGHIGNYGAGTPGVYPTKANVTIGGTLYNGTYSFSHLGGTGDATRIMGSLAPGECKYQYWSFSYPNTANGGTIPTWGTSVKPDDDLFLDFEIWASQNGAVCGGGSCTGSFTMTMRNEISAMANKIEPNGNPGGSWFNTNTQVVQVGETITTNGILYRLGNINQGFDNNGDLLPDYNAWLQPIGNPTYDPSCFRLIEASGVLTVTRSAGNPDMIIPFSHGLNEQSGAPLLYFTDLPPDNTNVQGLVYYTFMALGGPCTIPISPYQEVASGSDNEKFNGDYGSGGPGTIETFPPNLDFDKNGPVSAAEGGASFTYSIPFQNTGSSSLGLSLSSGFSAGFVISDTVPTGLQYVGGSAATGNTAPAGNSFTYYYSTNSGTTWTTIDPGTVTSGGPGSQVMIQWWLNEPLTASASGTVTFDAQVPGAYISGGGDPFIENCADARLGDGAPFAEACHVTIVQGTNTIGDLVWADDGSGSGVANNGLQDGTEAGIDNIAVTLYWDKNGNGNLDGSDVLISTQDTAFVDADTNYNFTQLPDGNYIVVVDTTDSDLDPTYTGYGPTTQTEYAVSVSGGQVYNLADFGFGPSLQIDKILLSSDPAYEGEDVTFRIGLTNKLPGDGTASGFCRYTIWATTAYVDNANSPPGGNTAGKQWLNTGNGLGAPDNQYTTTDMADASETIGLSGFDMGDQGGTITDVEVVIYFQEQQDFVTNSNLFVRTWDDGLGGALNTYTFSNVYFGGPAGTKYVIQQNVFADRAVWNWSHFAPNTTELQIEANKGSGPDGGEAAVDAVAYIVTTDQTCGGADSTIITLPVTDTYDADLLQFVSASPANSASTTSGTPPNTVGTINWANMGPLYGGQTKYITVTFTALDPGASTVNTINTADVTGAFFGNGRPVNDDNDDADVDIIPTGSIAGTVYSDGNSNGWQGTTGYDSLDTNDFGIPNVTVSLFGCYTANPASGGVLFTNVSITQACTGQAGGSNDNWYLVTTTTTASDGSYSFDGLRRGYYYVQVNSGTLPVGATQNAEAGSSATNQNGTGRTCGTCDHIWGSPAANLNPATFFNPIGTGNPLTTPNEDITNINFGYTGIPANIYGIVWFDENGDGDQDSGEGGISGATVRLCDTADCSGTIFGTQLTTANGSYNFNNSGAGLTPGNYFVVVTQPGNTVQTGDPDEAGTCVTCDDITTTAVTVSAGESEGSYDFGYRPFGAFSIGDTLYRDWNGDGTQGAGEEGLPNITVYLYEDEDNDGVIDPEDALMETDVTDANGNYSFDNLPNGNYIVVVETGDADYPANHQQTQDADGACPGAVCDDQSTSATIAGADDNDNDFGYQPQGFGSIGDYVWNDLDGDSNQDASEPGIDGVTVNLYEDQNGDGIIDPVNDALVATTTTAGGGAYDFTGLAAGNYIVEIAQTEFSAGQELEGMTMTTSGAAYTNNGTQVSYEVSLGAGEDFNDADFGFAQGLIGDFIWQDDNGNGTPDPGEPGIDGVTVTLYNDNDSNGIFSAGDTLVDTQVTAGGGLYQFGSLPAGDYVVVVTPPATFTLTGDPDAYGQNGFSAPPCDPTDGVNYLFCDHQYGTSLLTGQTNLTADFGYQPSAYLGDTIWIDSDNNGVRDAGESGIPFVTVRLCDDAACTSVVGTTETDAAGYYSFGNIPNGPYFLVVDATDPDLTSLGVIHTADPDGAPDGITTVTVAGAVTTDVGNCSDGGGACSLTGDFGYRFDGNNSITGTLWGDEDNGGAPGGLGDIDAGELTRYGNVTVYLWNCGAGTCGDGDEVLAGTTTSTITGTYSFTGLADGNYAVLINPGDPSITSLTPTTPTSYDVSGDPWVSFAPGCSVGGGCTAIRDFGLNSNLDFGDLPDIYNRTLLAEYGARHPIAGGSLRLGVLIDSDLDGQESLAADGDDNDGIDDDDGIVIPTGGTWGDGTAELDATVANGSGCLIGWVDYNGDGDFADTQADGFGAGTPELMFVRFLSTGTTQVIFPSPESTVGSGTYVYPASLNMRFRLFPANDVLFTANTIALDGNGCPSGLNSTLKMASLTVGLASSGEVEDYQQTFAPTAVTLQNISAAAPTVWTLIIATLMTLTLVSFMLVYRRRRTVRA